ncbi:TonB-dependent siderophore receptor [Agrobacterium larrymoorei]|uniref:TonB-dependent siderophore receptor n=1 Tax=Agrobacterium larrymoorei TaxID=160699 RepID=UPI0015747375|nr:TonB-dependent siderophore receptor [Agrobacterium larrymoorei]NTJ44217.1 TonB-dependent siderophore receptor [Agrobacterium larrymoorei]
MSLNRKNLDFKGRGLPRGLVSGSVVISLLSSVSAYAQQSPVTLEKITIQAADDNEQLPQSEGYITYKTRSGSKTGTSIMDIPQSVSTVTQKELTTQNPRSLLDALDYSPGVRSDTFGFDPRMDTFNIRGFDSYNNGIFRDGLRQISGGVGFFKNEPYGIEELTILKGSSSSLYGGSSAGGIVDITTKRPTEDTRREVEVQYGSHARKDVRFDLSGPAGSSDSVLYRVTGLARDADTERLGVKDDRLFIAPAITWKRDEDTSLTVLGEYMNFETGGSATFWNYPVNRITDVSFGDSSYNENHQIQKRIGYEFKHRFNDTFEFRQNARYSEIKIAYEYLDLGPYNDPTLQTPLPRRAGYIEYDMNQFAIDNQLQADFSTGPFEHTLLVGAEASWFDYKSASGLAAAGSAPPLNPLNPVYGQFIARPALQWLVDQDHRSRGLYIQDQIRYDSWLLTVAARKDWVDLTSDTSNYNTGVSVAASDQSSSKTTYRVGLSYETAFGLTPYVNHSTSFFLSPGTTGANEPFKPTTAESYEAGFKYLIPGTDVLINASVFDINQKNGVFYEIVGGNSTAMQRGELNARGLELEALANLDNGIGLRAGYQYLDMEIKEGEVGTAGNRQSGVPYYTFSLWGDYTIDNGFAEGLGFGAGLRVVGKSAGDNLNTFENASRVFVDAALTYDFGKKNEDLKGLQFQLNAKNIFDTQKATCANNFCNLDGGRYVVGSLKYSF